MISAIICLPIFYIAAFRSLLGAVITLAGILRK